MALISSVHTRLKQQLAMLDTTIDAAVDERERVRAALALAGGDTASPNGSQVTRRSRKPGPRPNSSRAPRGQNQQKVLEATAEKARTLEEIATITKIKKTTLSVTLNTMLKRGLLTKDDARRYKKAVASKDTKTAATPATRSRVRA